MWNRIVELKKKLYKWQENKGKAYSKFDLNRVLNEAVQGANCAECGKRLGGANQAIFYAKDTTKRTVHWNCKTIEDDPKGFV